jgi:hypothetical protein
LKGVVKDLDHSTFRNALDAWRNDGEHALSLFLPNLARDERVVYEAVAALPLLRGSLLPFGQTGASAAQLDQMQRAAAVADGHRSSRFIAADQVGVVWAMHLDRQGMPICNETLVGRTTHSEGRKYTTTFRHNPVSTQCSIPYAYVIPGTRRYDNTVERLQVGCISDTETTTPKLQPKDPQKRYCRLRVCQPFMSCGEIREAERLDGLECVACDVEE